MIIKVNVYEKINNKYKLVNTLEEDSKRVLVDILNYIERKRDYENIKIKYHYNYNSVENIDFYFSNGWKYEYIDIPCKTGGHIDGFKMIED